jgi:hypothetical protein
MDINIATRPNPMAEPNPMAAKVFFKVFFKWFSSFLYYISIAQIGLKVKAFVTLCQLAHSPGE